MSIARLRRLVRQAEQNARARETELEHLAGYVEISGYWVNPWDLVSPEDTISWARETDEALKNDDDEELRRLGEVGANLFEAGLQRAKSKLKGRV